MKHGAGSLVLALALGALALPAAAADAQGDWAIVGYLPSDVGFHPDEVPVRPAPGGFALTVVDGLWHLVPATLASHVDGTDSNGTQQLSVTATPPGALVYLRLPGLVAGKVDTPDMRFKGVDRLINGTTTVGVPFTGVPWRFEHKAGTSTLTDGTHHQVVAQAPERPETDGEADEHSVRLIWAGDLDHDGKLDFIIDDWFDDGGRMCVWLSSRAAPGQLAVEAGCMNRTY